MKCLKNVRTGDGIITADEKSHALASAKLNGIRSLYLRPSRVQSPLRGGCIGAAVEGRIM